ncbi:MAG: tRNA (guanosine(37)-N1)-methyltransferase TrmD [bacterium]|nr:tRNA (guanosine(37)-N1)-methyltransferase TrmD [bacterium]
MKFSILTLFPESIDCYFKSSMLLRAQNDGLVDIQIYNPRDYSTDKHKKADAAPYGGGPGMVLMAEPLLVAWKKAQESVNAKKVKTVILSPQGKPFTRKEAHAWARTYSHVILIAGHYEGIDDRVRKVTRAVEYSIGDYVLTGGELPSAVLVDAILRHIPGVLGNSESLEEKRSASKRSYTRPDNITFENKQYRVPPVLLSGDHKKIEEWRKKN